MQRLLGLLVLATLMAACTDKNVDDFRRDQVRKELAKIKSISGIYNGELTSPLKSISGPVAIEIQPDVSVKESSDGLKSETKAIFRGRLLYFGNPNSELYFDQGNYVEETGAFAATITVPDLSSATSDTSKQLRLYGNIRSSVLSARIEAYSYPNFGGKMELTKGTQIIKPAIRPTEVKSVTQTYKGELAFSQDKKFPVTLTVTLPNTSAELYFYNSFLPRRQASVSLEFERFPMFTDNGYYNGQALAATFVTSGSDSASSFKNELHCQKVDNPDVDQLTCVLTNSRRGNSSKGVFSRVK